MDAVIVAGVGVMERRDVPIGSAVNDFAIGCPRCDAYAMGVEYSRPQPPGA